MLPWYYYKKYLKLSPIIGFLLKRKIFRIFNNWVRKFYSFYYDTWNKIVHGNSVPIGYHPSTAMWLEEINPFSPNNLPWEWLNALRPMPALQKAVAGFMRSRRFKGYGQRWYPTYYTDKLLNLRSQYVTSPYLRYKMDQDVTIVRDTSFLSRRYFFFPGQFDEMSFFEKDMMFDFGRTYIEVGSLVLDSLEVGLLLCFAFLLYFLFFYCKKLFNWLRGELSTSTTYNWYWFDERYEYKNFLVCFLNKRMKKAYEAMWMRFWLFVLEMCLLGFLVLLYFGINPWISYLFSLINHYDKLLSWLSLFFIVCYAFYCKKMSDRSQEFADSEYDYLWNDFYHLKWYILQSVILFHLGKCLGLVNATVITTVKIYMFMFWPYFVYYLTVEAMCYYAGWNQRYPAVWYFSGGRGWLPKGSILGLPDDEHLEECKSKLYTVFYIPLFLLVFPFFVFLLRATYVFNYLHMVIYNFLFPWKPKMVSFYFLDRNFPYWQRRWRKQKEIEARKRAKEIAKEKKKKKFFIY